MNNNDRFFLVKLKADEAAKMGGQFEVQLLDEKGRAKAIAYVDVGAESVVLGGQLYPKSLLSMASSIPEGKGIYVNQTGHEVQPF